MADVTAQILSPTRHSSAQTRSWVQPPSKSQREFLLVLLPWQIVPVFMGKSMGTIIAQHWPPDVFFSLNFSLHHKCDHLTPNYTLLILAWKLYTLTVSALSTGCQQTSAGHDGKQCRVAVSGCWGGWEYCENDEFWYSLCSHGFPDGCDIRSVRRKGYKHAHMRLGMRVMQKQAVMTAVIALLVLGWVGSSVAQTSGTAHTEPQSTLSSPISVTPSDVQ